MMGMKQQTVYKKLQGETIAKEAIRLYEENPYYRALTDKVGYKKNELEEIALNQPYALPAVQSSVFKRSDMVKKLYSSNMERTGQIFIASSGSSGAKDPNEFGMSLVCRTKKDNEEMIEAYKVAVLGAFSEMGLNKVDMTYMFIPTLETIDKLNKTITKKFNKKFTILNNATVGLFSKFGALAGERALK